MEELEYVNGAVFTERRCVDRIETSVENASKKGHLTLSCEVCERIFQHEEELENHMEIHTRIRKFACDLCGMRFLQNHHLKAHIITHRPVKPHMCPMCGRRFALKSNMERHTLIHTGIRNYKCEQCGKTFAHAQTLKMHMVHHAEVKPYACNICGKTLSRAHNLRAHMAMHGNKKPHKCSDCDSSFTLRENLHRHQRDKHGAIPSVLSRDYAVLSVVPPCPQLFSDKEHNENGIGLHNNKIQSKVVQKCKNSNVKCTASPHIVRITQSSSANTAKQNSLVDKPTA